MKSNRMLSLLLLFSMQPLFSMDISPDTPPALPQEPLDINKLLLDAASQKAPNPYLIASLIAREADVNWMSNDTTALLAAIDQKEQDETAEKRRILIRLLAYKATPAHRALALAKALEHERWIALEVLQEKGIDAQLSPEQLAALDVADGLDIAVQNGLAKIQETAGAALDVVSQWSAGARAYAQSLIQADDDGDDDGVSTPTSVLIDGPDSLDTVVVMSQPASTQANPNEQSRATYPPRVKKAPYGKVKNV